MWYNFEFLDKNIIHCQTSAEVLHFYHGVPLALYWIDKKDMQNAVFGMYISKGERPQPQVSKWFFLKHRHAIVLCSDSSGMLFCSENRKRCCWWLLPNWSYSVSRMAPGWHGLSVYWWAHQDISTASRYYQGLCLNMPFEKNPLFLSQHWIDSTYKIFKFL